MNIIKSPLGILDSTLKSLKTHTSNNPLPKEVILQKINLLELSNRDRRLIFDKLFKDGYVDKLEGRIPEEYFITFNGLLFLEKGGYTKEDSRKKIEFLFKRLSNIILVIASIIGAVYSVFKICNFIK